MKKAIMAAGALVLLYGLSGCGSSNDPEGDLQEHIKLLNETADVLDTIKDRDSAEKARGKLKELGQRDAEVLRRLTAGRNDLSDEEKQRIGQKYRAQLQAAVDRGSAAWLKANAVEGAKEVLQTARAPK
jgi:hypothetical protein